MSWLKKSLADFSMFPADLFSNENLLNGVLHMHFIVAPSSGSLNPPGFKGDNMSMIISFTPSSKWLFNGGRHLQILCLSKSISTTRI